LTVTVGTVEEINCRDPETGFSPIVGSDPARRESETSRDTSAINASPSAGFTSIA